MWTDAQRLYAGRIMFPSSHDITPGNFEACMTVLDKLIGAGNQVSDRVEATL